ncbi:hypothetical protein BDR06DRAFT_966909 [Suillus hirtellus]|nr:hypothetical protein BDR06DRAFT_966909 [Suillus hirtellus]
MAEDEDAAIAQEIVTKDESKKTGGEEIREHEKILQECSGKHNITKAKHFENKFNDVRCELLRSLKLELGYLDMGGKLLMELASIKRSKQRSDDKQENTEAIDRRRQAGGVLKKLGLKRKEHHVRGMPCGRDMMREGYGAGGICCGRDSMQEEYQAGKAKANILCFDGSGTGTGSCFGIPGEESDDEAETIQMVQSSIPGGVGGDAVDAGTGSCFGIPGDELDDEAETM